MIRRLFILQYLLAVALCLGACAMRIRSFYIGDSLARERDGLREPGFQSELGTLRIIREGSCWGTSSPAKWSHVLFVPDGVNTFDLRSRGFSVVGIRFGLDVDGGVRERCVAIPWLAVILVLFAVAVLTFPLADRRVAARRRRHGLCPACGYDLRASPAQCPECGRIANAPMARPSRRSAWVAGTATLLVLLSIAALCWWSNPFRGTRGRPAGGLGFNLTWENARGTSAGRMLRDDPDWGQSWYQAIWHDPDRGDLLVIVDRSGFGSMVQAHSVTVLDRSMHVVRTGLVGFPLRVEVPYRLVEIYSDDLKLPAEYRGKWVLAIDSLPLSRFRRTSPEGEQTDFCRSIVEWGTVAGRIPNDWMSSASVKARPAEPAPTFQSDALQPSLADLIDRKMPELKLEGVGLSDVVDFCATSWE